MNIDRVEYSVIEPVGDTAGVKTTRKRKTQGVKLQGVKLQGDSPENQKASDKKSKMIARKSFNSDTDSGKKVLRARRVSKKTSLKQNKGNIPAKRPHVDLGAKIGLSKTADDGFSQIRNMAYSANDQRAIKAYVKTLRKEDWSDVGCRPLLERYDQLESIMNFEKMPLTPKERLQLAYHIEVEVPKIKNFANGFFISSTPSAKAEKFPPPRDIYLTKKGRIILMAKPELSTIASKGSYKEVFSAVKLYQSGTQVISKKTQQLKTEETVKQDIQARMSLSDDDDVEQLDREMNYYRQFKEANVPGIAKLRFYADITGKKATNEQYVHFFKPQAEDFEIFKLASFNQYDGSLEDKVGFTVSEKLKIFKDVTLSVEKIHEQGVIHGDLKTENILYKRDEDNSITTGVIDFGLSFDYKGKDAQMPECSYGSGQYGTLFASAPELLGKSAFRGSLVETECWALGIAFYEIWSEKQVPWRKTIPKPDDFQELSTRERAAFINRLRTEILDFGEGCAKTFTALQKSKKLTLKQQAESVIYKMLELNPTKRITITEALNRFSKVGSAWSESN